MYLFSQNVHQGYPKETLLRFLKAREWNVSKAHKMVTNFIFVHSILRRDDLLNLLLLSWLCICSL